MLICCKLFWFTPKYYFEKYHVLRENLFKVIWCSRKPWKTKMSNIVVNTLPADGLAPFRAKISGGGGFKNAYELLIYCLLGCDLYILEGWRCYEKQFNELGLHCLGQHILTTPTYHHRHLEERSQIHPFWPSETFPGITKNFQLINSLRLSDAIWRHRSGSTLAQVMACCLTAPSHYADHCWLITNCILWHSPGSNSQELLWEFGNYTSKIITISPRGQWDV